MVVEPPHPFQRRQLDLFNAPPGAALLDQFGLEQRELGLGEGVVITVAFGPNRLRRFPRGKASDHPRGRCDGDISRQSPRQFLGNCNKSWPWSRPAMLGATVCRGPGSIAIALANEYPSRRGFTQPRNESLQVALSKECAPTYMHRCELAGVD